MTTTPPSDPQPEDPVALRAIFGVLSGLRATAEGRLAGIGIAPEEYLADIYCIQRVTHLMAMELSALGRTLRRPETEAAAGEVHAIEEIMAQGFARAGWQLEDCYLDLLASAVRPGKPASAGGSAG